MTPWRSWLYVPAHRMDRVEKAFNSIADCVVLDLEDSVPAEQKQLALENCLTILTATKEKPFIIRINANTSPWHQSEISGINSCEFFSDQFAGIRIPKSETAASIHNLGETFAGRVALHPLIESAAGTLHMQALASAHDSVASISLGEADLTADLYWSDESGLDQVRAHLSVVSRALGLLPPPGSVYTNVSNEQGLIESTTHLKSLGFFGRNVIHPNQIAPVNQIFTPQPEEIQAAEELFTEVARQATQGATAFVRTDGSFIDPALVRNARRTIDVSEQIQSSTAPKGA